MKTRRRGLAGVAKWSVVGCVALTAACGGDKGVAPATRPAESTLGTITITPPNAIMAVGDTLTVTFDGRTLTHAPVTSYDSVQYVLDNVNDTARVAVSSNGLMTAKSVTDPNSPVLLDVFAFKDGVAAADQLILQITATRLSGLTISIHPVPPDSAKLAIKSYKSLVPVIQNPTTGDAVDGPTFRYTFDDADWKKMSCYVPNFQSTPTLTDAQLQLNRCQNYRYGLNVILPVSAEGTVWVRASATVYNTVLTDSVQYTLTNSFDGLADIEPVGLVAGSNQRLSTLIAPGGTVTFANDMDPSLGATVSFVLDDPNAATAAADPSTVGGSTGNISELPAYQESQRRFMTAGTYHWTATVHGGPAPYNGAIVKGVVYVQ